MATRIAVCADAAMALVLVADAHVYPQINQKSKRTSKSFRHYTLQVVSTVKRGKPETAARAEALLKPLMEWESTKAAKEKADPGEPNNGNVVPPAGNGHP